MAYFCNETGVRLIAPGVSNRTPRGTVPEFDGSDEDHVAAEAAAARALKGPAGANMPPSETTVHAAQRAALEVLHGPPSAPPAKAAPTAKAPQARPAPALERPAKAAPAPAEPAEEHELVDEPPPESAAAPPAAPSEPAKVPAKASTVKPR